MGDVTKYMAPVNHMEQYLMNMETGNWRGDMELMYAEYLDAICNTIKDNMVLLRQHLDNAEFFETMQTITKEVLNANHESD